MVKKIYILKGMEESEKEFGKEPQVETHET
jgi:hypothetical protein